MKKPTKKQLIAIENLSKGLNISIPKIKTKQEAQELISKLIPQMSTKMDNIYEDMRDEYGEDKYY